VHHGHFAAIELHFAGCGARFTFGFGVHQPA
jgi:hypothetical protein